MLSINTNLSSLIVQGNLKQSTNSLNTAIERMTTGCKLNHASDNAANYSIKTNMDTKIGAYMVAEDNTAMGIDLLTTAESSLSLIGDKLARLRTLAVQSSNGTYGAESQKAINSEANALIDEMQRLHSTTEYNGKKLLGASENSGNSASVKMSPVKFTRRDTTNMKKLGEIEDASVALADGTYSISSAEELAQLATMTNAGLISEGDEFVLAGNIDLVDYTTGEGWTPIGTSSATSFKGCFDGNGYTITNLYINRPSSKMQGLFARCENAKLQNVNINGANITGNSYCAILVSQGKGCIIKNCSTSGSVNANGTLSAGLCGIFMGEIRDCSTDVEVKGTTSVGGVVGCVAGATALLNVHSVGKVKAEMKCGGVVGSQNPDTNLYVANSSSSMDIFSEFDYDRVNLGVAVGGFIGVFFGGQIISCISTGDVCSKNLNYSVNCIGGFCGLADSDTAIENCFSTGDVNVDSVEAMCVGGFIGVMQNSITAANVKNSYSTGQVLVNSDNVNYIGGYIGAMTDGSFFIENSYTISEVLINGYSTNANAIGGFIGGIYDSATGNVKGCYNKNKITLATNPSVTKGTGGFIGELRGVANIENCSMLALQDSDMCALMSSNKAGSSLSVKNCYYSQEFVNSGLNSFSDENGNVINDTNLVSQVKTCATDDPFQLYINQQTNLQVGISSGSSSNVTVDTTCSLKYMNILRNIGLQEDDYLSKIDELMNDISLKQTQYGAANNRLLSAMEEISVQYENLVSSRSTIQDADMGEVSATYIQQQILQQASATLMATANQTPALALQLL